MAAVEVVAYEERGEARSWSWLGEEIRRQEWFLWTPVAIVAGIWAYFALPIEPHAIVFAGAGAIVATIVAARRSNRGGIAAAVLALALAGFLFAKLRAEWVGTPLLDRVIGPVLVTGTVESVSPRGPRRAVVILRVETIAGLAPEVTPRRLRLSLNGKIERLLLNAAISTEARLAPLPVPVVPGGFDYGRSLWFEGIGGTGRIIKINTVSPGAPTFWTAIDTIRNGIGARIAAAMPERLRGFAEALITGERGTIPKDINLSLQVSGLAHILSISGLHMALVSGFVFWSMRAVLALFPSVVLRRPIKKWAAVAALVVGLFYMLLAGASVATQRSYAMLAIMFFAILIDRPAISLRNLAIAALAILVLTPETAVSASFQMSFLAVAGLAAFAQAWERWRRDAEDHRRPNVASWLSRKAALAIVAAAATSLIAGSLSSIPAAYHFGRLAPLSLLANLLALPVISFVVMPAALASVLAMPFGLEPLFLWLLGEGLELVIAISDWVASLPAANLTVAALPWSATVVLAAGALWACLWQGRLRWAGLLPATLGLAIAAFPGRPDLLIDPTAATVAVRSAEDRLVPADARKGRFAAEKWLLADGDSMPVAEAAKRSGWHCTETVCRAQAGGRRIVYAREGAKSEELCLEADILIAAFPLRGACRSVTVRIDRFDVWRHGAHALTFEGGELTIRTSRGEQGRRPWVVVPRPRQDRAVAKRAQG